MEMTPKDRAYYLSIHKKLLTYISHGETLKKYYATVGTEPPRPIIDYQACLKDRLEERVIELNRLTSEEEVGG